MENKKEIEIKKLKILKELTKMFNRESINISFNVSKIRDNYFKLEKKTPEGELIETIKGNYNYIKDIILDTPIIKLVDTKGRD